jgi:hypothetical protein
MDSAAGFTGSYFNPYDTNAVAKFMLGRQYR